MSLALIDLTFFHTHTLPPPSSQYFGFASSAKHQLINNHKGIDHNQWY